MYKPQIEKDHYTFQICTDECILKTSIFFQFVAYETIAKLLVLSETHTVRLSECRFHE